MKVFVNSIRACLSDKNWHGALIVSLMLPDVCGSIEYPNKKVGDRYRDWYESFVSNGPNLKDDPDGTLYKYPSPEDCYALRCSVVHAGSEEIANTKTKEVLGQYHFFKPERGSTLYGFQVGNVAQIQVDKFCEKLCLGAEEWERDMLSRTGGREALGDNMIRIRSLRSDGIKLT